MSEDIYAQIAEVEAALFQASTALTNLRVRTNRRNTCGNPSHVELADKISSQQQLLAKLTRGTKTTERIAEGREGRLRLEIERLKAEVERLEPRAARGDHDLLARVKDAQQRRRILELKSAAPAATTALVHSEVPLSLAGLEKSPSRGRDTGWLMWALGALTTLLGVGVAAPGAAPVLVSLVVLMGLADYGFPGAQRDLVTAHMIYGERWKRIRSIEVTASEMRVRGKKLYRFHASQPGFLHVVRIALAAAASHGIPVVGEPPPELSQLALPIASS